ncbi:MAG: two-component sensor histidine kinase [Spirochaetae bacterium HGW-Spirochaetae-3]|jgi:two-component system sensor histidine kinase HydH|nr:MAG: two-component sensor histidine kinase [Spirochaetae bacterium HGW-Spirochaetae-3]
MGAMTGTRKRIVSIGLAVVAMAALAGLVAFIWEGMAERDRLESHNDAERTMNALFSRLRDHDDFGSAIEGDETLRTRILGIAAYADDGERIYAWGDAPDTFPSPGSLTEGPGDAGRLYFDNPANDSIVLVSRSFGPRPPKKPEGPASAAPEKPDRPERDAAAEFFFETLRDADFFYLEIREPEYWMRRRLEDALFPVVAVALAALVLFVRGLVLRNAEYRVRIEEQKNLVVLGTAASTLAHEIKNPLLSIRLQARILEKTCPESARREIGIINDEVDRLSALSHRVGDYLRDPAGNPVSIRPRDVAREVGLRLCGRDILIPGDGPAPSVRMDPERLRSVLENLVRNALESRSSETDGGAVDGLANGVAIEVTEREGGASGKTVLVDVLDRGSGISAEAAARLFDPFFTTKSRGTGIGLSVCRRFAEAVGGSVALEDRPEGGCRARLALPSSGSAPEVTR